MNDNNVTAMAKTVNKTGNHIIIIMIYIYIIYFPSSLDRTHAHLAQVADEEGSQHKGMYYAMQKLHIFGVAEPESSHPKWNSFRKAMEHSGMTISAMKLTLCCYQTASSISHFRPLEPFQKITN